MVAIVRGLGYAGAYIGGTHNPEHIRWIIQRSEELAPRWEELAEEISYGAKGGFYFFEAAKHPPKPKPMFARVADTMARLFPVKHEDNALQAVSGRDHALDRPAARPWPRRWKTSNWPSRSRCSDARPAAIAFWARWNTSAR